MEELTNKLKTLKPESPKKVLLVAATESKEDEESGGPILIVEEEIVQGRVENSLESSLDDEVKQSSIETPIERPQMTRQFTSPNDKIKESADEETLENDTKSEDGADIFSQSPVIDSSSSEDDEDEDGFREEDNNETKPPIFHHPPPMSPAVSKSRQISEEKMPHLLSSLQKKLLMVRQTSLEVSETYDRLSSPTKKSQNRPQRQLSFQTSNCSDGSPEINPEVDDHSCEEIDTQEVTDVIVTPYRPVALFRDLIAEEDPIMKGQSPETVTMKTETTDNNQTRSPSAETPLQSEMSPIVILYSDSSYLSTLPASNPPPLSPEDLPLDPQVKDGNPSLPSDCLPPNSTPQSQEVSVARISHASHGSYESDLSVSQQIFKEGFLMKRGFINTAFQRRWCVLKGKDICYYKQYRDKEVKGRINCLEAVVVKAENSQNNLPFAFYIHTPHDK